MKHPWPVDGAVLREELINEILSAAPERGRERLESLPLWMLVEIGQNEGGEVPQPLVTHAILEGWDE